MASITALGIGSGLDLNGLLDQLQVAERAKLQPLAQQKKDYQARISAYGRLEGALSQLQSAVADLGETARYQHTSSKVSGDALSAAAGNGAALGSYAVEVTGLARAYSVATLGVADKTEALGAATLALELGNGETASIDIAADGSSLEDIRDALNAADFGVRASIVQDGGAEPYRLVLASEHTGTQAAITQVDFGALSGQLALDAGTELAALDAALTVNGIAITSQSNQVEGAIEGVTLKLESEGSATLTVERDLDTAMNAVKAFAGAYNRLQDTMAQLTLFDAGSGEAGELLGDTLLRGIKSQVRAVLGGGFGEGALRMAGDIGLDLQLDGGIELDEDRLSALAADDLEALAAFLSDGDTGLAPRLAAVLDPVLAEEGSLALAAEGLDALVERVGERQERLEAGIEDTMARYRKQFGELDKMLAGMNATSDYLFQQFDIMNAQLGQK